MIYENRGIRYILLQKIYINDMIDAMFSAI